VQISVSVAFLPFVKRSVVRKISTGSNALRCATLEKLHYSAETLRVSGRIIGYPPARGKD
jgi:hypothetical protein